jgi:hypothetical protein
MSPKKTYRQVKNVGDMDSCMEDFEDLATTIEDLVVSAKALNYTNVIRDVFTI